MPTEFPSGSSTMAYRAPQNASSGALWLGCPAAVTRACTRSTSSRDETWKIGSPRSLASLHRAPVPLLRERDAVELDAHAVRRRAVDVVASPLGPLGAPRLLDRDAEQPVEGERPLHVADDDVDLLERERRGRL